MTDTQKQDRIGEMMREYREESRRQAHAASKVRESERDQQAALIASQARRIEELEAFYRAVAHAAGDLDQLPDSHAFEVVWCHSDEDGNPAPGDPFITAGQIRRVEAALAKIKEAT